MSIEHDHIDEGPTLGERLIDFRSMEFGLRIVTAVVLGQAAAAAILVFLSDSLFEVTLKYPGEPDFVLKVVHYGFSIVFVLSGFVLLVGGLIRADLNGARLLLVVLGLNCALSVISQPLHLAIWIVLAIWLIFYVCWIAILGMRGVGGFDKTNSAGALVFLMGIFLYWAAADPEAYLTIQLSLAVLFILLFYVAATEWGEVADAFVFSVGSGLNLRERAGHLVPVCCAVSAVSIAIVGYQIYAFGTSFVLELPNFLAPVIYLLVLLRIANFRGNWAAHFSWIELALVIAASVNILSVGTLMHADPLPLGIFFVGAASVLLCVCGRNPKLIFLAPSLLLSVMIGISWLWLGIQGELGTTEWLAAEPVAGLSLGIGGTIATFYAAGGTLLIVMWIAFRRRHIEALAYPLWTSGRLTVSLLAVLLLAKAYSAFLGGSEQSIVRSAVVFAAVFSEIMLSGHSITNANSAWFPRNSRASLFFAYVSFTLAWTLCIAAVNANPRISFLSYIEPEFVVYRGIRVMAPALLWTLFILRMGRWYARESGKLA